MYIIYVHILKYICVYFLGFVRGKGYVGGGGQPRGHREVDHKASLNFWDGLIALEQSSFSTFTGYFIYWGFHEKGTHIYLCTCDR